MKHQFSLRRLGLVAAGTAAALAVSALPAAALGISLGGSGGSLLRVNDCRSVALNRNLTYEIGFSSQTTGPAPVRVAVVADGSLTLCYDLKVNSVTAVQVSTWTDATVDAVVANLLNQSDASKVCTGIRLKTASGVTGTVTATARAYASVDGLPPVSWSDDFARDTVLTGPAEDIVFNACLDTNGGVSAS